VPTSLSTGRIAELVGGRLVGPEDTPLVGLAPLTRAGADELAFVARVDLLDAIPASRAGAVLVSEGLADRVSVACPMITVPDAYVAAARVLEVFHPEPAPAWGVDPGVRLGRGVRWRGRIRLEPGVQVGAGVHFGADCELDANVVVGAGALMGDRCRLGPGCYVGPGTRLGDDVHLAAGARIGTRGFGYAAGPGPGARVRLPHTGRCVLEHRVDVGANATIDRGTLDDTVVGEDTKIDNLVHVGHNCRIGARCLLMAQVGLAGSTVIGDDVIIAGQAGLAGHLRVGDGARVAAQSGVIGDVPAGSTVSGYPARPHREVLRQSAALARLSPIVRRLERLASADG